MRATMKRLAPAVLTALCMAIPAMAQEKPKAAAAPEKAKPPMEAKMPAGTSKTLVDNDRVTVIEVHYKPGQGSEMRERGPRVTRALTDGTMERTYKDGKKEMNHWKAGEVKYFPKETFANKNVGKTDVTLFVTTLK